MLSLNIGFPLKLNRDEYADNYPYLNLLRPCSHLGHSLSLACPVTLGEVSFPTILDLSLLIRLRGVAKLIGGDVLIPQPEITMSHSPLSGLY